MQQAGYQTAFFGKYLNQYPACDPTHVPPEELYDLQAEPYELESLHESADPALVEDLKARLEALKSCSEEGCQEAEDAP